LIEKDQSESQALVNPGIKGDVLLLVSVSSEEEKLKEAAQILDLQFEERSIDSPQGEKIKFYSLGKIGNNIVHAVRTEMGPFSYGGSASKAIYFRIFTGATAIVQLGKAYGIDQRLQNIGDVVVSSSVIPYDRRIVLPITSKIKQYPNDMTGDDSVHTERVPEYDTTGALSMLGTIDGSEAKYAPHSPSDRAPNEYLIDYSPAKRHKSNKVLLEVFLRASQNEEYDYQVFFGGILSGGAQIRSRQFLGELIKGVPQEDDGIVGGEMEGVGLLSVSPRDNPIWIIVKGISDFADANRDSIIEQSRPIACLNAAKFVLSALKQIPLKG